MTTDPTTDPTPVLEIAVYTTTDPDALVERHHRLHDQLATTFPGHLASLGLRSTTEPDLFADVVLWSDHDAATAAAAALPATESLAWFPPLIDEVRFFDHLAPAGSTANPAPAGAIATLNRLADAPLVELITLRPAGPAAFAEANARLHEHLGAADTVVADLRLGPNDSKLVGDLIGWTGPEAMEETASAMMARPELAPVFDETNEMLVFMPATVTASR